VSDVLSNLFEKILLYFVDIQYTDHEKQFGFKKSSSCSHAIFVLLEAIHYSNMKKLRLYTIAIDFSKAFDKVNRLYLWFKLIENGIEPAIIRAIVLYYELSEILIQIGDDFSTSFYSTIGVRQGGVLSPRLFAIYIHALIDLISILKLGLVIGKCSIDIIAYADDILIVTNSKRKAQIMLDEISKYCDQFEIKINADKTVLIIFNYYIERSTADTLLDIWQNDLTLQNVVLTRSHQTKYLGVIISDANDNVEHINKLITSTTKASGAMKSFGLQDEVFSIQMKINMYKTYVMPVLSHGLDVLILSKTQIAMLKRTEASIVKQTLNICKCIQ
jgi:hypothetical protein